ncbi:hypothetical protein FHS27_005714 [Rhodopirellula rubra]|uniref:Transmembrane protein n=1 Tax=Aporhodopirellula rubra TaxID=980271 RepID=A0A7W5E504_9BACT|nr:hypothetical protein [Aporhodopirellula rubra]MBB3209869.1 hypothetical protein [Aporhodopirellula rubra]
METFEQVWETSRVNGYSWVYPCVVWSGIAILILLSLIRRTVLRRIAKLIAIIGLTIFATHSSAVEIQEKWRIRGQWADLHSDQMSESDMNALMADGANLVIGPFFNGFVAMLNFSVVALSLLVIRLIVVRFCTRKCSASETDDSVTSTGTPIESGNPYQPPV